MNTIQYYVEEWQPFPHSQPTFLHIIITSWQYYPSATNTQQWSKWQFCSYCVELTWSQYMCKSYSTQIHIMEKNQVLHNSSPWVTSGVFCIYKSFQWVYITQGKACINPSREQHKELLVQFTMWHYEILWCNTRHHWASWDAMDETPCMRHHGIVWQRFHETPWDTSLA